MRMRNKLWILGVLILMITISCYDDKGNYSYQDPDSVLPLEIDGLPKDTSFMLFSEVELTPKITGIENEDDFQFTWYTYQLYASGFIPQRDTLAKTKDLSFIMEYPAGNQYQLVFEAKEKKTGLAIQKKILMRVTSEYSKGWFILEDEDGMTDMDFILEDGTVRENLLTERLGERMKGEAVKLVYMNGRYTDEEVAEDGTVTILESLQALHILTTQDMKTLNPGNLSVLKNFDEEFYNVPSVAAPQNMDASGGDIVLINAGRLHSLYGMSNNVGKFGVGKTGPGELASDMLFHAYAYTYAMLFSRETKSFVMGGSSSESDKVQEFLPEDGGKVGVSTSNMDKDLICMLQRTWASSVTKGWALMRGINDPEKFYLADIAFSGQSYPLVDFDEISSERGLCHADVYGAHQNNSIYFAKGNVLSYYQKNASDLESLEALFYEFPAGETIAFIQQTELLKKNEESDEEESDFSNLIVLTNSATGWKLYRCPLEGDGLSPTLVPNKQPVVIAAGKGYARFALPMQ